MWGLVEILVWSRTLILWRSHDSSYNSLYTEEFPDPSMSVTTIILCILLNIIPLFICTVFFCKHLFIVVAVDGFLPRKGTGLRWLISSYQTIHAVRLFYSLYDSLPSPPQCNIQCNLCYMSPVLNGSSLTAHADSPISYITYFQMTNILMILGFLSKKWILLFILSSIYWAPNQHIRTIWRIKCHNRNNLYIWKNFQKT